MSSVYTASKASFATTPTSGKLLKAKPALIAGFLPLLVYLATPTANYYWDGLAFAARIERVARHAQNVKPLFHRNHLLYNATVYLLYVIPRGLGLPISALTMMQLASTISCAVGVGIFFGIARRISGSLYIACVGSALLAVSTCWWKSATDADAYSLSVVLVLACASTLFSEHPRWYVAGLGLAGAMLIHELAALFYPAAIVAVLLSDRIENRFKFGVKMTALAWGITVVSYYAVAVWVFGMTSPTDVIKWAASNPYGDTFVNPLPTLAAFPKFQIDVIFGHDFEAFRLYGGAVEVVFASIGMLALCAAAFVIWRRVSFKEGLKSIWPSSADVRTQWKQIMPVLLVWIATYALFQLFWEPFLLHYRVYYAPAVVLMFVLGLSNYHQRSPGPVSGAAALAVVALFFLNLAFFIAPYMRSNSVQHLGSSYQGQLKRCDGRVHCST